MAMTLRSLILSACVLTSLLRSLAATVYVQTPGAGSQDGSDWNNAMAVIPETAQSGTTYFIGSGSYVGREWGVFHPAVVNVIVKKAGLGSETNVAGWNSSYASPADFGASQFWFGQGCSNITISGSYSYGFTFETPVANNALTASIVLWPSVAATIPGIKIEYCNITGAGDGIINYDWTQWGGAPNAWGLNAKRAVGGVYPNLTISHCRISGNVTCFVVDHADGFTVEYCELAWAEGSSADHGNIGQIYSSDNVVFRYNFVHNFNAEGLEIADSCSNSKFYGNVVYGGQSVGSTSRFIEDYDNTYPTYTYANNQYYNNTLVDLQLQAFYFMSGAIVTNPQITNNIFFNTSPGFSGQDYNWYSGSDANGETHGIAGGSSQPFTGYLGSAHSYTGTNASWGFQLAAQIAGATLGAEFNADIAGNIRTTWSRGAYEFAGSMTNPIASVSPSTIAFGTTSTAKTNTVVLSNAGGGTLIGIASVTGAAFSIISGTPFNVVSNASTNVLVKYTPATESDSGSIAFNGGSNGTVTVYLSGNVPFVPTNQVGLTWPSTNAYLGGAMHATGSNAIYSSSTVLNGPEGDSAEYYFLVTTSGTYTVSALVNAPNPGANSFYLNINSTNSEPGTIWDIPITSGWINATVTWRGTGGFDGNSPQIHPATWTLTAGTTNHMIIEGREANTLLGQITVSAYVTNTPTPASGTMTVTGMATIGRLIQQ